jgi:hypothetical protein
MTQGHATLPTSPGQRRTPIPRAALAAAALLLAPLGATAQPRPAPTPNPAPYRATSVTLAQVVQRQEENYARMRTGKGAVAWTEATLTSATGQWKTATRAVTFAFDTSGSVLLIVSWDPREPFPKWDMRSDWSRVLAAALVEGERVFNISVPRGAKLPEARIVPFNPAVHENNPLVAFHPRLLGDEKVRLRDLLAASPRLPVRPALYEYDTPDGLRLRIDFYNPSDAREFVYYVVNPQKGYLAEEIGQISGRQHLFRTRILIGNTPDGTFIPARREKTAFDDRGNPVAAESWYYDAFAINQPLGRMEISLGYFHLPKEARIRGLPVRTNAPDETHRN